MFLFSKTSKSAEAKTATYSVCSAVSFPGVKWPSLSGQSPPSSAGVKTECDVYVIPLYAVFVRRRKNLPFLPSQKNGPTRAVLLDPYSSTSYCISYVCI